MPEQHHCRNGRASGCHSLATIRDGPFTSLRDPTPSRRARRMPGGLTVPGGVPRCGTAAAGTGSKGDLKGRRDTRQAALECADLCPPTYEASPTRWTERAKTSGNSHCTPTDSCIAVRAARLDPHPTRPSPRPRNCTRGPDPDPARPPTPRSLSSRTNQRCQDGSCSLLIRFFRRAYHRTSAFS